MSVPKNPIRSSYEIIACFMLQVTICFFLIRKEKQPKIYEKLKNTISANSRLQLFLYNPVNNNDSGNLKYSLKIY